MLIVPFVPVTSCCSRQPPPERAGAVMFRRFSPTVRRHPKMGLGSVPRRPVQAGIARFSVQEMMSDDRSSVSVPSIDPAACSERSHGMLCL
jgi:hypothetical protein